MRSLLIAASFLLAAGNLMPTVAVHLASFGGSALAAGHAAARPAAVTTPAPVAASMPMLNCAQRHAIVVRRCTAGDTACVSRAMDAWDMCDATGLWHG